MILPHLTPSEVRHGRGFSLLPVYRLAPSSECATLPALQSFWVKERTPSDAQSDGVFHCLAYS
jgi:hypothetical protein